MFKKIMLAALAAGALALNAPVASADPVPQEFDCGFDSNQQEDVTGQNYEGVIWGYVTHPGDDVSIRCYLTVNGSEVGGITASGTNAAATAGRITFAANDTDDVKLCYEVVSDHPASGCFETTHMQLPPEAFYDALDSVIDVVNSVLVQIDPTICPIIGVAANTYGPVTIAPNGSISVDGDVWYICP